MQSKEVVKLAFLQKKAIYNLLQINLPKIRSGELEIPNLQPWQIEDYRVHSTELIIKRLEDLGVLFNHHCFTDYASKFEEPEDLFEAIAQKLPDNEQDQIFLY